MTFEDDSTHHPAGYRRRVLVTGASGFIGRAVCRRLVDAGWHVIGQHWQRPAPPNVEPLHAELGNAGEWAMPRCEAVIHLAGMYASRRGEADLLWRMNVDATRALVRAAVRQRARFVFLSSAKVLGETGEWNDQATPAPRSLYAMTKLAAEEVLQREPDLDYIILRPPLVIGPGAQGNARKLMAWADSPWPLPFASLDAPRSFIYVEHLAEAIVTLLAAPNITRRTWLVSDQPAMGVAQLIKILRGALHRPSRLFAVPPRMLYLLARSLGRGEDFMRISAPFILHPSEIHHVLGWSPPATLMNVLRDWCARHQSSE